MKDKKTLIVIVVVLVISLPLAILGILYKNDNNILDDNKNKDYIYNNSVYFYQNNDLLKKYTCKNTCSISKSTINDNKYGIHSYQSGKDEDITKINNSFALFKEGSKNILYNYETDTKLLEFDEINNYNVKHNSNILIVKKGNKYGVINLNNVMALIPTNYDYIAIPNRVVDNTLDTSKFIALKDNTWRIIDNKNKTIFETSKNIIDFNNNYVVLKNEEIVEINDFDGNSYLSDTPFTDAYCIGKYILIIYENNLYVYEDFNNGNLKTIELNNYSKIEFKLNNNNLEILLDGTLFKKEVLN